MRAPLASFAAGGFAVMNTVLPEALARWRAAERLRDAAPAGSDERRQAEIALRHARFAYEAEAACEYDRHDRLADRSLETAKAFLA